MPPSEIIFPRAKERFAGEINGEGSRRRREKGKGAVEMRTRDRITRHARPRVPAKSRSWKRKQVGCHRAAVCNFL